MHQIFKIIIMLRPYWRFIFQALAVGIMVMIFSIPGPYLTKVLIDDVYPHRDYTLLTFILLLGAIVSTSLGLTNLLSDYFSDCVGVNMALDFKLRFYSHIQSLDFSFFDKRETGEVLSRFNDMDSSVKSVVGIINNLTMNTLYLLIFPPILFYIDWRLALLSLAVLPFDTLVVLLTRKHLRRLSEQITRTSAGLTAKAYESISGIRTVQALGLEGIFNFRIRSLYSKIAKLEVRYTLFGGGSNFVGSLFKTAATFAYGWYGWSQILEGNMSLGSYMAFSGYIGYLYGPVSELIGLIGRVEMMLVHTNRFFEVYDLKPDIQDNPNLPSLPNVEGEIRFHRVSFSYDGQNQVLHNINLQIPAHTTTALVGKSGSGKSTLAKLIPRFYGPQEGYISIEDQDIRQYRLRSLRRSIGFAMQGSTLFQGSVMDNLTFGGDIPFQRVEEAVRSAYIHDIIMALPDGYHTMIGEQGVQLSEGQKQRIALARVLLMNTPILILDEPTSALDTESEFYIQEAFKKVKQGRTVVIVAHRLSTIQNADKIVVLEGGRIVEEGSHDLLLTRSGVYANLHNLARI